MVGAPENGHRFPTQPMEKNDAVASLHREHHTKGSEDWKDVDETRIKFSQRMTRMNEVIHDNMITAENSL